MNDVDLKTGKEETCSKESVWTYNLSKIKATRLPSNTSGRDAVITEEISAKSRCLVLECHRVSRIIR